MSIAVSVLVRPSRLLRLLQGGFCLSLALAACAVPPEQAWLLAAAALAALHTAIRPVKPVHIDISGVGRIRLTVYQYSGAEMRLLAGSTFWPQLMLLRLQPAQGRSCWLLVLPDSVARQQFRRLALALRAIAARS
jgi:toxin CptA